MLFLVLYAQIKNSLLLGLAVFINKIFIHLFFCFFGLLMPVLAMDSKPTPVLRIVPEDEPLEQPEKVGSGGLSEKQAENEIQPEGTTSGTRRNSAAIARKRRSLSLSGTESAEDQLDRKFYNYLKSMPGFSHIEEGFVMKDNEAMAVYEKILANTDISLREGISKAFLPPGRYAPLDEVPFAVRRFPDEISYRLPRQGWKIHISASEKGALKIAGLILPVIDERIQKARTENSKKYNRTYFKISSSMPSLRTMYYITGSLKGDGRETQLGKFLTIYPANLKHARALVELFDGVLSSAKKIGIIDDSDFCPLYGEALVGESGGVYVRYGNMSSAMDVIREAIYRPARHRSDPLNLELPTKKKGQTPHQAFTSSAESFVELTNIILSDNRYRPWPDFMNKANVSWKDAKAPFKGMRYIAYPDAKPITWDTRPDSW